MGRAAWTKTKREGVDSVVSGTFTLAPLELGCVTVALTTSAPRASSGTRVGSSKSPKALVRSVTSGPKAPRPSPMDTRT